MFMTRMWLVGVAVIVSTLAALLAFVVYPPAAQANHSWNGYHRVRTGESVHPALGRQRNRRLGFLPRSCLGTGTALPGGSLADIHLDKRLE